MQLGMLLTSYNNSTEVNNMVMTLDRFEKLLEGDHPTLGDLSGFLSVVEKLPAELLWQAVNSYPNMNFVLRGVMLQRLAETVQRENVDNALNDIVTRLAQR